MACERGAVGVSLRGGSLGMGAVTLLWSAQSRGVARGTAGSTIHHIFSSHEGAAAPQRPPPLPWAGDHCTTRVSRDGSSPACLPQAPCKTTEASPKGKEPLPPPQPQPGPGGQQQAPLTKRGVIKAGACPEEGECSLLSHPGKPSRETLPAAFSLTVPALAGSGPAALWVALSLNPSLFLLTGDAWAKRGRKRRSVGQDEAPLQSPLVPGLVLGFAVGNEAHEVPMEPLSWPRSRRGTWQ